MNVEFIWGPGGVGKTHVSLREAYVQAADKTVLLMTLDPSLRLFDLLHIPHQEKQAQRSLIDRNVTLKSLQAISLFEALERQKPASVQLKAFYQKMSEGLQDFRNYLSLIQLSQELESSRHQVLIVDTPPLQEAAGLERSLFQLKAFFETSLIQLALKTTKFSLVHFSVKKVFDLSRLFVGKAATDRVFELFDWMIAHRDRFERAAHFLERLVFSNSTRHTFILAPDSKPRQLHPMSQLFQQAQSKRLIISRSVWDFPTTLKSDEAFVTEMSALRSKESRLRTEAQNRFPRLSIEAIPFVLMGDDSDDELQRYLKLASF